MLNWKSGVSLAHEAVSQTENTSLRSRVRDPSVFWNYFHHVLCFFIGNLKKQSNRINTDYDGFGNVLLAPYWLVGGFCFLGSFFVNCGVSVLVFFLLLCGFISRLNISFQHHVVSYVIIYFWSSLFSFISIQTQSVYIHFDFLCWYLAFFNQLIIIVLWSLTPKFPEIKKILFPNFFYVAHSWFCGVWAERCR